MIIPRWLNSPMPSNLALGDERRVTVADLNLYFSSPEFDRMNDSFILERAGKLVGMTDLEFNAASGRTWADGVVHPDLWHQGIGTQLISLTEARALARAEAELKPDQPLSIQRNTSDTNAAAIHLFETSGYHQIRSFYQMRIELDHPVEAPPLPPGIVLRPFEREQHARGGLRSPAGILRRSLGLRSRIPYEEWAHFLLDAPDADFSMWLLAFDEATDQIAGICLSGPFGESNPQLAWTRMLGVRRPWRKRGLGLALLQNSFALFQARGYVQRGAGGRCVQPDQRRRALRTRRDACP